MFAPEDLTTDGFLGGRVRILQPRTGYRAATDPVLLAAAVAVTTGQEVLELGTGAGVASLCLSARVPGLRLTALELQSAYADLARRNADANGVALEVIEGDVAAPPASLRTRSFDHVMANPPYYSDGAGTAAADAGREAALREVTPLDHWIDLALRRLRPGGWLWIIQAADRLPDLCAALQARAGDVVVLPIVPRQGRRAGRVILRARKGGKGPFRLASPFVMHDGDTHQADGDDYAAAARAVLRDGADLILDP